MTGRSSSRAVTGSGAVPISTAVMALAAAMAIGALVTIPNGLRVAIGGGVIAAAGGLCVRAPAIAICTLPVWLVLLGLVRRSTSYLSAGSLAVDPLLAVGPVVILAIAVMVVAAGAARERTRLTYAAMGLIGVLALSSLNPRQGSIEIGLTGVAVAIVPMLAFLIGRSALGATAYPRILVLVAALGVPVSLYGLYQMLVGFPPWDRRWVEQNGYAALNLGNGVVRAFSTFASGQELATYAAVALVVLVAFHDRAPSLLMVPLIGLMAAMVWFESGRTTIVLAIVAIATITMARAGWSLKRSLLLCAAVLATIPWLAGELSPARFGTGPSGTVAAHNLTGLAEPLHEDSTLHVHIDGTLRGIRSAFAEPFGYGIGTVTRASSKFGGRSAGMESDLGKAGVAAGVLGLGLYLAVVVLGFVNAFRRASEPASPADATSPQRADPDPVASATLGILIVTALQWLNGGLYSIAWLAWLAIGWLDRPRSGHPPVPARDRALTSSEQT